MNPTFCALTVSITISRTLGAPARGWGILEMPGTPFQERERGEILPMAPVTQNTRRAPAGTQRFLIDFPALDAIRDAIPSERTSEASECKRGNNSAIENAARVTKENAATRSPTLRDVTAATRTSGIESR